MNLSAAYCLVFSFCFVHAFGQEKEFLDKDNQVTTEDKAVCYRLSSKNEKGQLSGTVKEYYLNGNVKTEENYLEVDASEKDVAFTTIQMVKLNRKAVIVEVTRLVSGTIGIRMENRRKRDHLKRFLC